MAGTTSSPRGRELEGPGPQNMDAACRVNLHVAAAALAVLAFALVVLQCFALVMPLLLLGRFRTGCGAGLTLLLGRFLTGFGAVAVETAAAARWRASLLRSLSCSCLRRLYSGSERYNSRR